MFSVAYMYAWNTTTINIISSSSTARLKWRYHGKTAPGALYNNVRNT